MTTSAIVNNPPVLNVGMGQLQLAEGPQTLTSILGSCVGVAMLCPRLHLAALAHVVLPDSGGKTGSPGKFADTAITHLVELLVTAGARRGELSAKLTGGAQMFSSGPMRVGENNIQAARRCLAAAQIPLVAEGVGGTQGRRITLDPGSGELTVSIVNQSPVVL